LTSAAPHRFPSPRQRHELDRFWADPKIRDYLSRPLEVVTDRDVPDLAGYATFDPKMFRLYVDRHLAAAKPDIAGRPYDEWIKTLVGLDLANEQIGHEPAEAAAIDVWGYSYPGAHEDVATPAEHSFAKYLGIDWRADEKELAPWIKRTEIEKIERPPLDLNCAPYYDDPDRDDLHILKRLRELHVVDAFHQDGPFHPEKIGAKQAPDGRHYIKDHASPGDHLRVHWEGEK
jgi:hypothetical protein